MYEFNPNNNAADAFGYMNWDCNNRVEDNRTITPLMSNPGVYEMHQTTMYNNYGQAYDSHLSCYDGAGQKMWQHTLLK